MSRFNDLNNRVIDWADDKGILDKATPLSQHDKTQEEIDELLEALKFQGLGITDYENTKGIVYRTDHEIKDALGDILVTLLIQSKLQGLDILDCLEMALNVIERRTGKMVNGIFVKDK